MHPSIGRALSTVVLSLAAGAACAQSQPPVDPAPAVGAPPSKRLEPGDPAPALDIANWLKGPEVKAFEKGRVYVVEFWATWCAPCRGNIPHLTALQAKYPDHRVTVIGVSTDQGGVDPVKAFVDARGDRMAYSVALDGGGTNRGYMGAVGATGIPYAFIVDQSGKMVWHGFPHMVSEGMDLVLGEVLAGKFDIAKHKERMARFRELDQKYSQAMQAKNWDDAEKTLDEILSFRPDLTGTLAVTRYGIIANNRSDPAAALAYARKALDTDFKDDSDALVNLANVIVGTPNLPAKDQGFATQVARRAVEATKSKNAQALVILSFALEHEGKLDEAITAAQAAKDLAQEQFERNYYDDRVNTLKQAKEKAGALTRPAEPAKP